ncbi:hypothetical protein DFP72DRAFT_860321 [Ephemerocybe angulata]|uniref:Uncharacterized protein n=1 Tax=Ephemerocybe angulata TaxID=980116 RepID=A0A8H6LUF3_9AGAR|nr:hypothetical protein DFP72DRAFT_860321 [Tulosesus angulatus]
MSIRLCGCTNEEFESLLEVLYPEKLGSLPDLMKEQWTGALKLSRLWIMAEAAAVAIEKLSSLGLTPTEKIKLGKTHEVPKWLEEGYTTLVSDISIASKDEMAPLGWETIYNILRTSNQVAKRWKETDGGVSWDTAGKFSSQHSVYYNHHEVSNLQTACGACSRIPAKSGYGATDPDPAALSTATGDRFKLVAEEVAEVFKEDLEDAEFHNNAAVPEEGHA